MLIHTANHRLAACHTASASSSTPFPSQHLAPPITASASSTAPSPSTTTTPPNPIRAIVTDVDGTLLNSSQRLTQRTVNALNAAVDGGVQLVLATGKARGPWLQDVAPRLQLHGPTVFLQGLLIYGIDGSILHSRALPADVCHAALEFAQQQGLTVTVYSDDRIVCAENNKQTDRLLFYREPPPEAIGPLHTHIGSIHFHKILLMGDDAVTRAARPDLEAWLGGDATVTTALPGMLEILPLGASKGTGVGMILPQLGVSWEHVLAAGDGENDLEMLQAAGWAVAMGNASEQVKKSADYVTLTNDEDGLAAAVEQFVLKGQ